MCLLGLFIRLFFSLASKDRLSLLRSWVSKGQNADSCEAAIVMEKSHSSKFRKDKELLKVSQMAERGYSELLDSF